MLFGQLDDITHLHTGRNGDRVTQNARLITLDASHFSCLLFGCQVLWMIPMPPSWAIAIARRASVTVSMAADTSGRFN